MIKAAPHICAQLLVGHMTGNNSQVLILHFDTQSIINIFQSKCLKCSNVLLLYVEGIREEPAAGGLLALLTVQCGESGLMLFEGLQTHTS